MNYITWTQSKSCFEAADTEYDKQKVGRNVLAHKKTERKKRELHGCEHKGIVLIIFCDFTFGQCATPEGYNPCMI